MNEPIESPAEEKTIYEGFLISLLIKGLISLNEVISGLILLFIPLPLLIRLTDSAIQLLPNTQPFIFIATHITSNLQEITSGILIFLGLYALSRGFIKLLLIWAMLKKKLWAYPWSLGVLGAFLAYQFYLIYTTHSGLIVAISVFDMIVMYFIWREYKIVRAHLESTDL